MLRRLQLGCHLLRLTVLQRPPTISVYMKTSIMADVIVDKNFPSDCLVPKSETGVLNFLKKYPEYNGDGVTIAILDSGVDPKAVGLERTPDGSVKVIERFDCSGCGDVDTSKKVSATADGFITGLSGHKIKLSETIKKESTANEFRVGVKSLHDLYPAKVNEKIVSDLKLKTWDETHKLAVAEQSRRINEFDTANSTNQNLGLKDKLRKDDLDNGLECLQTFEKQYLDNKTTYDCILYQTKNGWQCAIDIAQGNLEKAIVLGEYSKTHDIKSIDDFLSISINVHDDGNVLEIVGMCSSHGTHVASIASGNQSTCNKCEMDGVAPAAKIVSLTIGDGRLGSMETGTAIIRALIKIMELCDAGKRVHLINMSYGEFTHWSSSGRVGEIMNEIVNDYGVVWIASAGNHGPALCTIGTPPDISQPNCISVGAYVSPEMMVAEYSLREKLPGNVYTWTSRDPCIDGGQGVTICAPGAAITSVPEFTLNRQQLMNGTSMSAPHVCGAVALLISGLLKNKIDYSPYSIKRALWNTATKLDHVDPFAQGNGLLNVERAYENLVKFHDRSERDARFAVSVDAKNSKGIHWRCGPLTKPEEFCVSVQPVFQREKYCCPKTKINFNMRLTLVPSAPWVQCGSFLDLCYSPRSIGVKVDPTGLSAGVHSARIRAYESDDIEKGTVFEVPITVVQPVCIDEKTNWRINFGVSACKPNTILRHFIQVPPNATWAVLRLRSNDTVKTTQARFLIHTMQVMAQKYCKTMESQKILPVSIGNDTLHYFKVEQNNILEVCIAKYWANFGDTSLKSSIEFHGIRMNGDKIMMHGAGGVHRIDVTTLSREDVVPVIQLKTAQMVLKPTETKITPLSQRDVLPNGRQIYQNVLTYNLNLSKNQEVAFSLPLLTNVLYESEYDSQLWMCFDSNKKMVSCGDAYSATKFTKLNKGDYAIRVQVRQEKKELLEKLNEATLTASFKLASPIPLDVYSSYRGALLSEKKISIYVIGAARTMPLYVAPLSNEKLTKAGFPSQCAWLQGTISTAKDEIARKIDVHSFEYVLPDAPSVPSKKNGSSKNNNNNGKETKSKLDEYKEGLRDFQNAQITKLDIVDAMEVYSNIIKDFPTYLSAHISLIQKLELAEAKNSLPLTCKATLEKTNNLDANKATLQRIIDLADVVIKDTNADALLAYYGLKTDNRPDAAKIKTEMDKQKATLLEAYVRKIIAVGKLGLIESQSPSVQKDAKQLYSADAIDIIYTEVGKFIDYTDPKVIYLSLWHAYLNQHYGRMTKILQKMYEEKPQREILDELQSVARANKWDHIGDAIQKIIVSVNPAGYRLF